MTHYNLLLLSILILLVSCQSKIYSPSPEVSTYVQAFYFEAARRKVKLPSKRVKIIWGEMENYQFGKCLPRSSIIVLNQSMWSKLGDRRRKRLVFHELAHCFLGRTKHRDDILPRGECASLLTSEDSSCICNIYERNWWTYYVDELFNPSQPLPDWYEKGIDIESIRKKGRVLLDTTFSRGLFKSSLPVRESTGNILVSFEVLKDSIPYEYNTYVKLSIGPGIQIFEEDRMSVYHGEMLRLKFFEKQIKNLTPTRLSIFFDHSFLWFYVNDKLVYKMGKKYVMSHEIWDGQTLKSIPIVSRIYGLAKESRKFSELSGQLKIFEIQ